MFKKKPKNDKSEQPDLQSIAAKSRKEASSRKRSNRKKAESRACLLYTSDAADEL